MELRPGVIIQRGIKTRGHNSTKGPNFIRRRCRNTMTPCLRGSQFNMKNPLNPEHSPLNQDPKGRNSMGSKFNPTPARYHARQIQGSVTGQNVGPATATVTVTLSHITSAVTCTDIVATRLLRTKQAPPLIPKKGGPFGDKVNPTMRPLAEHYRYPLLYSKQMPNTVTSVVDPL